MGNHLRPSAFKEIVTTAVKPIPVSPVMKLTVAHQENAL